MKTGISVTFALNEGEARKSLAHLRMLGYDCADLHWVPYRGVVDWVDFARALHEIGFEGALSLETNVGKKLPASIRPEWEKALAATARHLALGSD